jgi:hypothetical protein
VGVEVAGSAFRIRIIQPCAVVDLGDNPVHLDVGKRRALSLSGREKMAFLLTGELKSDVLHEVFRHWRCPYQDGPVPPSLGQPNDDRQDGSQFQETAIT